MNDLPRDVRPDECRWPALPLSEWEPTYETLHMYLQVVGKVVLATTPLMNHWWNVTLRVGARGFESRLLGRGEHTFEMFVDVFEHELRIARCDGKEKRIALGGTVKDFYLHAMSALASLGVAVRIWPTPVEVADPVPFDRDRAHATYVPEHAHRIWDVLRRIEPVLDEFRARFTGKCSPVHFFWGSFDLATTRFSGRPAPPPPGSGRIARLGYNAELSSVGFWPGGTWVGGTRVEEAIFYSYAYPQPEGFATQKVMPAAARYDGTLGEFVLPYEHVRCCGDPEAEILAFAQSTYEAGARLQGWAIEQLAMSA